MTGATKSPELLSSPSWRRRILADVRPLQESREFRRLWIGSSLSGIGGQMTSVAVAIQVYSLTRSSLAVGLIGLFQAAPLITIGLLGGSLADLVDRRRLVLATSSLQAIVSAALAVQAILALRQVWLLYLLIVLESGLSAIDQPARRTFIPRLLLPERIPAAAALSFLSFHLSMVLGPFLAGEVIATAGLPAVYIVDALSFAFSIYGVARLRPMLPEHEIEADRAEASPGLRSVAEGLRFVYRQPILATVLLADMNATVFGMPFALFPALAATHFGGGPRTVGFLYAAPAVGGALIALFSGFASHVRRQGRAVLLAVAVWGAAIALFGFTRPLWLALIFLGVAGAADVVTGIFRLTLLQVNTPDALRGRVNSVGFVVGAGVAQLGNVEAGIVAQLTSPVFSAMSGGIACVLGVITLAIAVPSFARYDAQAIRSPEGLPSVSAGP